MAPDANAIPMRRDSLSSQGSKSNLSGAFVPVEIPAPREPPAWWADWARVKKSLVRTDGQAYDPNEAAVYNACHAAELPPICAQSTFVFGSVEEGQARFSGTAFGQERPFARVYTRLGNPTTEALEKVMLNLECGYVRQRKPEDADMPVSSLITGSGMGAISAVLLALVNANEHIICGTVYGCTHSLMHRLSAQFGVTVHTVDASNLDEIRELLDRHGNKVRAVYVESIENPTLQVADIAGISALTEPRGVPLVVDNTFATPYNTQPFRLGADIVVHSTTKYMNGHSTAVGGAIVGPTGFVMADCFLWYKDLGSTPSPFDCWSNLQNIQDLPLRVGKQAASARELAEYLENHSRVASVKYPGLRSHPQHAVASKQMRTGGGMISFEVRGGYDAAVRLMDYFAAPHTDLPANLAPVHLCVSLGAVTTYIEHPASMTHKCVPKEERLAMGITDTLVRLSVGIDGAQALQDTFERALAAISDPEEHATGA